jgi:hypothetical protein
VNPQNVLVDDGNSATYSNAAQDFLFVQANLAYGRNPSSAATAPDYMTVSLKAWCSSGGTCGTGNNAQLEACITLNGVSCWPSNAAAKFQTITLGTSPSPSTFLTLGSTVPILDSWMPTGYTPLNPVDTAWRGTDASSTAATDIAVGGVMTRSVLNPFGTPINTIPFHPAWIAGSHITLNGQDCTIQTPISRNQIQVDPGSCTLPSLPATAVTWSASNFGWLIRHKTTSLDQINIQYAKYTIGISHSVGWPASGSAKVCADNPTQNSVTGHNGYLCFVIDSGIHMMYWIDVTTGDANVLGILNLPFTSGADGWDTGYNVTPPIVSSPTGNPTYFGTVQDHSGKWIAVSCAFSSTYQSGSLNITGCTNLTVGSTGKDLLSLAASFTASDSVPFDPATFTGIGLVGLQDRKLLLDSLLGGQDSIGWHVMFDPDIICSSAGCVGGGNPGAVVGTQNSWAYAPARFCAVHTTFPSWTGNKFWTAGPSIGAGDYISTITAVNGVGGASLTATPAIAAGSGSCPVGSHGCDNITVNGEPQNGSAQVLSNAAVGDVFRIDPGTQEFVRLNVKAGTSWQIERGYGFPAVNAHPGSFSLYEMCLSRSGYYDASGTYVSGWNFGTSTWDWVWDFAADPHGMAVTTVQSLDHVVPRPTSTLGGMGGGVPNFSTTCNTTGGLECYAVNDGVSMTSGPTKHATADGAYGGKVGIFSFILSEDHPSRLQNDNAPATEQQWLNDGRPITPNPDRQMSGNASLVSGQLYKMTPAIVTDADNYQQMGGSIATLNNINRKFVPTMAYCGSQAMVDVSSASAGNVISDTSADSYNYCIARKANECRTGSSIGDLYANCPIALKAQGNFAAGQYGCDPAVDAGEPMGSICAVNTSAYIGGVNQIGYVVSDGVANYGRMLSFGGARYQATDNYWTAMALPDASWLFFRTIWQNNLMPTAMLMKLPSFPKADVVSRNNYQSIPVNLTSPGGSVTNAIVYFGYVENGASGSTYCTSRQEACLANAGTVPTTPFKFPSEGTPTGVACTTTCTIAIPAISQRMLYWYPVYRDAGNATVSTGPVSVLAVP